MHPRFSTPIVFLVALASAASAFAQQSSAPRPAPPDRPWFVAMTGGAVSQAPGQAALGVEVGERIGRHAQGYFAVSYFDNLMSTSLSDDLDATAARLATATGDRWAFSSKDRGVSVIGGGKYLFGGGTFRPFVGGGEDFAEELDGLRQRCRSEVVLQPLLQRRLVGEQWTGEGERGLVVARGDGRVQLLEEPLQVLRCVFLLEGFLEREGQYWGAPADDSQCASYLAARGYLVFAIDYRHAPRWTWPAQIEDVPPRRQ